MAVNQVYKATVVFNAAEADGEMMFNLHYRTSTVLSAVSNSAEAIEIGKEIVSWVEDNYLDQLGDDVTFERVDVIGISDPLVGITEDGTGSGAVAGDSAAWRSAPVAAIKTGLRGRSYNGRAFLIAPPESMQDGGVLTGTYRTNVDIELAKLLELTGSPSGNSYKLTVYSKTLSDASGTVLDNVASSFKIRRTMGTQKSRQSVA